MSIVDEKIELEVEEVVSLRIDKFLSQQLPDLSRVRIQDLIRKGCLRTIQGKVIDKLSYKINYGDKYILELPSLEEIVPEPQNIPIDIVFEDDDVIVVNKSAGMVVHAGAGNYDGTLVNALLYHCKEGLSGINGKLRPGIVHRIDKDTSGLLVVAKNDKAHRLLSEQFATHSIHRRYYAFVWGNLRPDTGTIDTYILRNKYDRLKMMVSDGSGKKAITHYEVCQYYGLYASLIECSLETGRTHQIRVHLSHLRHALIGDGVYGDNNANALHVLKLSDRQKEFILLFKRQALHAYELGFIHPNSGEYVHFGSALPQDLLKLKDILQNV